MDNGVDGVGDQKRFHQDLIQDVAVEEGEAGMVIRPGQVVPVAGIGQRIQDNNAMLWIFFNPVINEIGADKAGTAGDQQIHFGVRPALLSLLEGLVLKFGGNAGLFAEGVRSNPIKCSVSFNWYSFQSIGINRMVSAFSQKIKAVLFKKFTRSRRLTDTVHLHG